MWDPRARGASHYARSVISSSSFSFCSVSFHICSFCIVCSCFPSSSLSFTTCCCHGVVCACRHASRGGAVLGVRGFAWLRLGSNLPVAPHRSARPTHQYRRRGCARCRNAAYHADLGSINDDNVHIITTTPPTWAAATMTMSTSSPLYRRHGQQQR